MKKLTDLPNAETLNVEELMKIKGAVAVTDFRGCSGSKACSNAACTHIACTTTACSTNACATTSCNTATCRTNGCNNAMDPQPDIPIEKYLTSTAKIVG